jgi:hypothetical protein
MSFSGLSLKHTSRGALHGFHPLATPPAVQHAPISPGKVSHSRPGWLLPHILRVKLALLGMCCYVLTPWDRAFAPGCWVESAALCLLSHLAEASEANHWHPKNGLKT